MSQSIDWTHWEPQFAQFLAQAAAQDAAHDRQHIRRVVSTARRLAAAEGADLAVVVPAAWLHDCVVVPKDSPQRSQASTLAARAAGDFLHGVGYPEVHLPAIEHAIAAHSFSAAIQPRTIEARVVQDADRLDAIGAIGVARCLMLGGALGRRLYDPAEPFPATREPDDLANTVDHFYLKLLRLADSMTTAAGRAEARRRTLFLQQFLDQLRSEI
ncbi:MAG TPA: HD domain-containing protein [Roseiflexaceae bacterium]|nr:HD domain-containing protein [Roseiflexaceae bacterium]